jgi:uncharacterized repeat protein (TIGR03943 family)
MDERTQGALMLAIGGVSLRLGLTDAALAYVKAGLQPLLTISGIVLLVLGATAVIQAFRSGGKEHEAHDALAHVPVPGSDQVLLEHTVPGPENEPGPLVAALGDDGHGHGEGGPKVAWMLVLPLLGLLLIAPPPLGAFAAGRQGTNVLSTNQTSYPPLPEPVDGAIDLTLSEYTFRALYDEEQSLEGERLRLVGFVTPKDEGDGYYLTRFILSCCAADGRAITIDVSGDQLPRAPDTWLEIEGTWEPRPGAEPGQPSPEPPLFVAESVTPIAQPDQPYEY